MTPLLLSGAGGHARVVIELVRAEGRFEILGVLEKADGQREAPLGV